MTDPAPRTTECLGDGVWRVTEAGPLGRRRATLLTGGNAEQYARELCELAELRARVRRLEAACRDEAARVTAPPWQQWYPREVAEEYDDALGILGRAG